MLLTVIGLAPLLVAGIDSPTRGNPASIVEPTGSGEQISNDRIALIGSANAADPVPIPIGAVMVSASNGDVRRFSPDGTLQQVLDTKHPGSQLTGSSFDSVGNFWVTLFDTGLTEFDPSGSLIGDATAPSMPESILFDSAGNIFLGQADGNREILKLNSTGSQQLNAFKVAVGPRGTDWIDLASDDCTMFYDSEGTTVRRYNVCTGTQLPDFNLNPLPGRSAYALRILPKAISSNIPIGSVLVADSTEVVVLDNNGNKVRDDTAVGTGGVIFALNLDPDGTTYWTADAVTTDVFRVGLADGKIVAHWSAGGGEVGGLSIKGELKAVPTPTPTATSTPTPTPTPTAGPGGMVQSGTPVSTSAGAGATVNSGSFTVVNTSGTTLVTPTVTISFDNADVFSSATLTGAVGAVFSAATVNPVDGGNSPEQPNSTQFALEPPLVVPTGQTATFSLSVTVSNNPQQTRRDWPIAYAGVIGSGANGSGALLIGLALLELCVAGMSSSRRRRLLMAGILFFVLASQLGCDNGSTGGGSGTPTGVVQSTQTAMAVAAMKQANNSPVAVGGLPVQMGTVAIK